MSNELTNELKAEIFAQESANPFLTLVTLTGPGFAFYLVDNTVDVVSQGQIFSAFPMKVKLPVDDGESAREFDLTFDNASLDLIRALRGITSPIDCRIDMILASDPDTIQMSIPDLQIRSTSYNKTSISAKIVMDNFLSVAIPSEKYTPTLFPGIF